MKQNIRNRFDVNYLRSTIFGLEDALVSTTGVVVGITAGGADKKIILLASIVTVAVEAISMGAGEYLSEESVDELKKSKHKQLRLIFGALLMFFSYSFAGAIPVLPVVLLPKEQIMPASLALALISLFTVGYLKGKFVKYNPLKSAIEMLTIGGIATVVGVIVGLAFKI